MRYCHRPCSLLARLLSVHRPRLMPTPQASFAACNLFAAHSFSDPSLLKTSPPTWTLVLRATRRAALTAWVEPLETGAFSVASAVANALMGRGVCQAAGLGYTDGWVVPNPK